jgi:tetratricopeptide (TPR) repeat protein
MIKKCLITILMIMLECTIMFAQTTLAYFTIAQEKLKVLDETGALQCYQNILQKDPNNIVALQKATFYLVRIAGSISQNKKNVMQAKLYADRAIQLAPNSAEINYIYALALGKMVDYVSLKQKVTNSRLIKYHADKAIALQPNFALAWNMLGRYNLEVSRLNKMEKLAANSMMGGLPDGDINTAIQCFEKCRKFDTGFIANYLNLIEAYLIKDDKMNAKKYSNVMQGLPNVMKGDAEIKIKAKKITSSL